MCIIATCKKEELKNILTNIKKSLKYNGIFYVSLKNGQGEEIIDEKYYNYLTYEDFLDIIKETDGLKLIEYYNSLIVLNNNEQRSWNNFI